MPTEVQGDVPVTSGSGSGSTTASGTTPDRDGSSTDVLQRETGRSVLHPDVTFGAAPHTHILHILAFIACCLTSIGCLIAQLPINADTGSTNWWSVLLPQLVFPLISIAFHGYSIIPTVQRRAIRMQLGDTPDPSTMNNGSVLQHQVLERVFRKTYIASNCSDIALYVSIVAAVTVLLVQLEMGWGTEEQPVLWKMVGLPIALGGLAAVIIQTLYRVRNRGAFPTISTRSDFAVIFVFLAAYKLDKDSISWTITFIFLFWWIIAFILLGMAGIIVYHAGRRAHLWNRTELNVRLGVSLVHLSYVLLLVAAVFFFKLLRGGGADGKPYKLSSSEGARLFTICLSMTAAWAIASSVAQIAVFRGQKQREEERETQIAEGRVWTRWTGGASSEMATIVRQVDALSPEEIIKKASEMMQNVSKPTRLYRMDTNLWSTAPKAESNTTAAAATSAVDGTPTPVCGTNTTECRQCTGPDVATGDNTETESAQAGPSHVSDSANLGTSCSEVAVNIPALGAAPQPAIKHSDSLGAADSMENDKDMSCLICFEELGDHVMMPCGHGGYCKHCAHKLYVRPPNLCPICRASLVSVVKVSLDTPIGSSTGVS